MRIIFRFLIRVFLIVVIGAVVAAAYFHLVPVAPKVRAAAEQLWQQRGTRTVSYAHIPEIYKEAVIATEDRRFSTDPGIDPVGMFRSLAVDVEQDGYVEGGSTITQQLVDNTILGKEKTLSRKVHQTWYAIGLYESMSKKEIFSLYANVIYFGHGAYGINAAAETYFGKPVADLNDGQLTMLAGLPNSPSRFDPLNSYALARSRQKVVLKNMVDAGYISSSRAEEIYQEPLALRSTRAVDSHCECHSSMCDGDF